MKEPNKKTKEVLEKAEKGEDIESFYDTDKLFEELENDD
jgi:hypothetical protein